MDLETYQQSVSQGSTDAARFIAVLGRVVIGAVVVVACVWVGWLGRGSIVDKLNVFFAWVGKLPRPQRPVARTLKSLSVLFVLPRGLAVLIGFVVGYPVGWLSTRRWTAILTAGATVAVGVYLSAFHLVGVRSREYRGRVCRRFWHRTPNQMVAVLAGLSSGRA